MVRGITTALSKDKEQIRVAHHASCAALRVTGHGASAYADFCGRRLPTVAEWFYAVKMGKSYESAGGMVSAKPKKTMPLPTPVMVYEPNGFGIRGLNANMGEWGRQVQQNWATQGLIEKSYVVLGWLRLDQTEESEILRPIARYPAEAFEKVGFRCVRDVGGEKAQ